VVWVSKGRRRAQRGQTALETAFVFSFLLFMTFMVMNLGILLHTKNIATYAAFMAARSFQVLGDQTGAQAFLEMVSLDGDQTQRFMQEFEGSKYPAFFRVAEDIFTCGLPWMSVPDGDAEGSLLQDDREKSTEERCMSGKRKYATLNIGEISFAPFDPEDNGSLLSADQSGLEDVAGGFAEDGRNPLRYGVLRLPYRSPILFDPMGTINGRLYQGEIYVPALLNPGLSIELKEGSNNDANEAFKNSALKNEEGSDEN
jgi:hypothetical protein